MLCSICGQYGAWYHDGGTDELGNASGTDGEPPAFKHPACAIQMKDYSVTETISLRRCTPGTRVSQKVRMALPRLWGQGRKISVPLRELRVLCGLQDHRFPVTPVEK